MMVISDHGNFIFMIPIKKQKVLPNYQFDNYEELSTGKAKSVLL